MSALVCLWGTSAWALDKQGSAHGGSVAGADHGVAFGGSLMLGIAPYNPSYAARPDNSGLALMRYAAHGDLDLVGRRLSLPLDVNLFSDRRRAGGGSLAPSELDLIGGVTSTLAIGPGALEIGLRAEHDRAVDRDVAAQTYVDLRARYLWSAAALAPRLASALRGGDIRGAATLGWFALNRSYFARPDNSGLAALRYGLRAEVSGLGDRVAFALDATLFTDREQNFVRPSELDFTPELILRHGDFELHAAWELDRSVDTRGRDPGYTQQFVYALLAWGFAFGGR